MDISKVSKIKKIKSQGLLLSCTQVNSSSWQIIASILSWNLTCSNYEPQNENWNNILWNLFQDNTKIQKIQKTISKKSGSEATYSIRQCSTAASDVCHSFEILQDMLNGIDIANMTIKGHFFIPKDFLQKKLNLFNSHHNCKIFRLCIELNTLYW